MAEVKNWSTALRLIKNEILSAKIIKGSILPIITIPTWIYEDMSEQLHLEITGKSAMRNLMHKWCHVLISMNDPCSAS